MDNRIFYFLDDDRPVSALRGQQIQIEAFERRTGQSCTLEILVDFRQDHPACIELQGYTELNLRQYRATIVINHSQKHLDSILLIPHV